MKLEEFQIWFNGFQEGLKVSGNSVPTESQWNIIKTKLEEVFEEEKISSIPLLKRYERNWPTTHPPNYYSWDVTQPPHQQIRMSKAVQEAISRSKNILW